ncbi:HAMP domain-containing protein [Chloroflexia bacterium SDU3-3]|nr:HAMP domain-containing protein [Chloroflexia bacterium SDU3-3]
MRLLLRILAGRISNKIVLPYLLLALCIGIATTFVAVRLTTGALQDRMDNRLIEAGQVTSDSLVATEDQQIEQLRAMAFTEGVPEALAAGDTAHLAELLRPHWANNGLLALVAFDAQGQQIIGWQRDTETSVDATPADLSIADFPSWWLTAQITGGKSDTFGDKFSAFRAGRLFTAAPVRRDGVLVGGLMVAVPLDTLLERLQSRSQASVTTFYDSNGVAVATTQILAGDAVVPPIPASSLAELRPLLTAADPAHIQNVAGINGREYQFAYSPLRLRRAVDGYFSVALPRSFIVDTWAVQRLPLAALALVLLAAVVAVGTLVSRRITRPLEDLARTARSVASGELERRSAVDSRDELGVLARSFNQMTERLLHLYETSRTLSAHNQIGAILAQASASIQPIVPGAVALALLADDDGWRFYVGDDAPATLHALRGVRLPDGAVVQSLVNQAAEPQVAEASARRIRNIQLPPDMASVCYMALSVQHQLIGLLLLAHAERGVFGPASLPPIAAVASMTATALHNTRLYLEVQEEGARRRVILESIADAVIVCDAQRFVVLLNPAAEALLKVRDWQRRRYHFNELPLVPIVDASALLGEDGQLIQRYEALGQTLRASSAVLSSPAQAISGEVIVLHNISAEAALDQAKTDLIALISHELRTPLTAIQSAADMLKKGIGGELNALQTELADTALRQSYAMSALIDKAIMVANIENGTLDVDTFPTGLELVVTSALQPLRDAAAASEVELLVDVPKELPLAQIDGRLVKVALQQIVDNAIKYGVGAPVRLVARAHGEGIAIAVRDFGPGIAAEQIPHLFSRLHRGADALNQAPRGMGLGLMIARELIERQGGSVSVQSELGQGSLFTIFLPGAKDVAQAVAA